MGLATGWELTRRGHAPIVLERFARGHAHGASHGATRNYNNAYAQDHYLELLQRARIGWDALGVVEGEPLLRLHGLVTQGAADVEGIHAALAGRGMPSRLIEAVDAARRWPGIRFEGAVLHSPDAGVVRADVALRELEGRIVAGGGQVRWGTRVHGIDEDEGGVTLTADGEQIRAENAVVTAGAWTSSLLPDLPRLTVTEESFAHFAPRSGPWPSFNHYAAGWPGPVYGMPTPGEGVKVGLHHVGREVDPDRRRHELAHSDRLRDYVRDWLPGLDPGTAMAVSCTYTSTADGTFVLDRRGRVVIGAGFSGHGFKFAPGVGAVLADLVEDEDYRAAAPFRLP